MPVPTEPGFSKLNIHLSEMHIAMSRLSADALKLTPYFHDFGEAMGRLVKGEHSADGRETTFRLPTRREMIEHPFAADFIMPWAPIKLTEEIVAVSIESKPKSSPKGRFLDRFQEGL